MMQSLVTLREKAANPSINRTRNGGPRWLASVAPVAPFRAGYLKR